MRFALRLVALRQRFFQFSDHHFEVGGLVGLDEIQNHAAIPGKHEGTRRRPGGLLRRWLWTFGPGRLTDIRWWTGWTAAQAKGALADVDAEGVDVGGTEGFVLPDDTDPVERPDPWARLLPGLDPTTMGWKERDWYLGPHADRLFDRNGNAGPTVWANGRVIGGWAQTADGRVVVRLLQTADRTTRTLVERERRRLEEWFSGTRVVPRFRTPLERALAG